MKVPEQPLAVILVRVADEQHIHIEPILRISDQPLSKLIRHVRCVLVRIVSVAPDIHVDQYFEAPFGLDERHVAIANGEERERCSHGFDLQFKAQVYPMT